MNFKTQMLLKSILDSDVRTRLEFEIGYDAVSQARNEVNKGFVGDSLAKVLEYIVKAIEEAGA
jgi:hypothetical protein